MDSLKCGALSRRRLAALCLVASAVLSLPGCGRRGRETSSLLLYCGAGIRPPVAEMVTEFQREHPARIECDYAGSNLLLSRIKLSGEGDLYMPGDAKYVAQAEAEGLIASAADACYFVPVILVAQGNPKRISQVTDLAGPGLRVGLGDPEACAIGKATDEILAKNSVAPKDIERNVVFRALTVNELGLQIETGKLDAAVVWDAVAHEYEDVGESIAIPREANVISTVPVAVLRSSKHPDLAAQFRDFVVSERGREIFARHGYTVEPPR